MRWGRIASIVALLHCLPGCGRTWLDLLPADADDDTTGEHFDAAVDAVWPEDAAPPDEPHAERCDADAVDAAPDGGVDGPAGANTSALEAGSDGGGAAACPADTPAASNDLLIDDLEDGDALIRAVEGRRGAWYTVNDGSRTGSQTPATSATFVAADGGARGSARAARTFGSGFWTWGAALGVRLNDAASAACGYDASAWSGIRFYARGSGIATVSILSGATVPVAAGGRCVAGCLDYYATHIVLTTSWSLHEIAWRELHQSGWGTPVRFDPAELFGVEFAFGRGVTFDLYVDDLAFY